MRGVIPSVVETVRSTRHKAPALPKYMKFLAFASVCFMALLPSAFIVYYQGLNFARETVEQLALHLTTLHHTAREGFLTPQAAVITTQNNKLVTWCTYYRGNLAVARAGLTPLPGVERKLTFRELHPEKPIAEQLPEPDLLVRSAGDFKIRVPMVEKGKVVEYLELGLSYAPIYSLAQDQLALSSVLLLTAFLFLLGAVIFSDLYVSKITSRFLRAIRSESADSGSAEEMGIADGIYAPTFNSLMEALERREDQLIDTRDTLETVFDGLQMGVAMVSTEMRIVLLNEFLLRLLGRKAEGELVSQKISLLNFSGQSPSVEDLFRKAIQTLRFESQELELTEGERRFFVQEVYPLFGDEDQPVAFIFQCRDVTTEHNFSDELQRQLAVQKKQLEDTHQKLLQSSRLAAVGELAGGVAHEINNPNGVIMAGARYVLNRIQGEEHVPDYIQKYLERIIKQSERVADIVRALLTFSRRRPQEKGLIDINDAITDALEIFQARLENRRVVLKTELPMGLPKVSGNRNELAQVFLNLFNNAVDAMPEGGEIQLSAESATLSGRPALAVRVRDTGAGVPRELIEKIMEPFFTTKPVGKGTGLGLSISHGIIEEHAGTFKVRNHPEGGAEFEIVLPASEPVPG